MLLSISIADKSSSHDQLDTTAEREGAAIVRLRRATKLSTPTKLDRGFTYCESIDKTSEREAAAILRLRRLVPRRSQRFSEDNSYSDITKYKQVHNYRSDRLKRGAIVDRFNALFRDNPVPLCSHADWKWMQRRVEKFEVTTPQDRERRAQAKLDRAQKLVQLQHVKRAYVPFDLALKLTGAAERTMHRAMQEGRVRCIRHDRAPLLAVKDLRAYLTGRC